MKTRAFRLAVDRSSGVGLVEQLTVALKTELSMGRFSPGEVLPGIDAVAAQAGVSEKVARRALSRLAADGWVKPRRGVGSVVQACSMKASAKRVLLFQTGESWSFFVGQFVSTVQWRLQRAGIGFSSVFAPGMRPNCDYSQLVDALKERWDLIVEMGGYAPSRQMIEQSGMPFVVVRFCPSRPLSQAPNCIGVINLNNGKVLPDFVRRCRQKGVRRVLQFLYGVGGFDASDALKSAGVEVETVSISHQRSLDAIIRASMRSMSSRLASGAPLPDVILFTDDYIARGGLLALSSHGVRIPADVAVVSHANKGLGPVWTVPLTRMEMDPVAHGKEVASMLLRWLEDGSFRISCESGSVWRPGRTF